MKYVHWLMQIALRILAKLCCDSIALSAALLLTACGGGSGGSSTSGGAGTTAPVVSTVAVTAVTPTVLFTGANITITGQRLDRVSQVIVGGVTVTPSQISATQLTLAAPGAPASTTIQLILTDASVITLSQTVRVDPVISITGWTPTSGLSTNSTNVTITGSGLSAANGVISVHYGNGLVANIVSQSNSQLVFTIPAGAASGPIVLLSNLSGFQDTVGTFTVTPGVSVTGMSPSAGPAQTAVTITGVALDTVTSLTVGGVITSISSQTTTTLNFLAPAQSGAVLLSAPGGQSVNAGTYTYQPASGGGASGATVSVPEVDMAQTYSQPISTTSSVALVSGKAALLRAYVIASAAIASPTVTATLAGCAASPTLTLTGPATLPTSLPAAANLSGTFNGVIPASCVNAALTVKVNVAASASSSAVISGTMTPKVGRAVDKPMDIVLVPLVTNGATATIPSASDIAALKNMLDAVYPLPVPATVTVRAPYTMTTTQAVSSSQWSTALDELKALWVAEVPGGDKQYYGLVPDPTNANALLGLGYVNTVGDTPPNAWMVAIGEDISKDPQWTNTLAHEVGHNNSLEHAPCGVSGSTDPNWPTTAAYANAGLGLSAIYDRTVTPAAAMQPAVMTTSTNSSYDHDIMSYCNSLWFSDYNYANIQNFHNSFSYARVATFSAPVEMLDFSGEISNAGVLLRPTSARMTTQPYLGGGDWTLRLFLANGTEVTQSFKPVRVADGQAGLAHFLVSVVKTAEVIKVQIEHAGQVQPLLADPSLKAMAAKVSNAPAAAQLAGLSAPTAAQPIRWHERAGKLLVHWDGALNPFLSVRHVGTAVTVLGIRLQGGYAELDTAAAPAGGDWEFGLSNGLSAKVYKASRQ